MKFKLFAALLCAMFMVSACQTMQQASSPTDTFKAYAEALKKKDAAAAKGVMSKASLKMAEDAAKEQGKTVDEMMTSIELPALKGPLEFRNEKIEGDNATVEIKNEVTGGWDTMYFVKEDGRWKLAMDKAMDEIMKKVEEQMKNFDQTMPGMDDDAKKDDNPKSHDR